MRAQSSAICTNHLMVATGKRATITAGLIKGPIGQSEEFDHQAFASFQAYLKSRGMLMRGKQFAQDPAQLAKVFASLKKVKECPQYNCIDFGLAGVEDEHMHNMLGLESAMFEHTEPVPTVRQTVCTRVSGSDRLECAREMAILMARREVSSKRDGGQTLCDRTLPDVIQDGIQDAKSGDIMGSYQVAKKGMTMPNEDARPSARRDRKEIAADSLANVSINEYKDQAPRLGVHSIKYSAKLKMSEVDLMTSRALAEGQLAATFRMRMGRDNPGQLKSFLQSRVAGPSGGTAQEQAEAGAAGGGPPSGGAASEQAEAGEAGGKGEENAATVSTSPASSEYVSTHSSQVGARILLHILRLMVTFRKRMIARPSTQSRQQGRVRECDSRRRPAVPVPARAYPITRRHLLHAYLSVWLHLLHENESEQVIEIKESSLLEALV